MAISTTFEAGEDDWTLISSTLPTSGASSISLTSIPSHRKLLLVDPGILVGTSSTIKRVRINNDTTVLNYLGNRLQANTPSLVNVNDDSPSGSNDFFTLCNAVYGGLGFFIIESANTSNPKLVRATGYYNRLEGLYLSNAPVTRLDLIFSSGTVNVSNTLELKLYGVK